MEEPRRLGGRYELGRVLGRGGMAEVHLAHDTRLGRTVAVKTLRVDLARDPTFQARFRREAQSAASLNHPAIVAVYDTGEDYVDGISIPYIVMECVDGSTLRELLHSGRKLLPERSLEMCIGILQALEYSHRNGIVHRDIKPANVMLTRNGQVKVMDFGIARAMGDSGMTMTQTAAVIGTAQYLSPEQAKGETVDNRSDLYSAGCLLYELLTVRPPFVGDSPVAVAYQHVREEPQPPSVYDPEIPAEIDAIVLKALMKDPDYRYQSADEMRADMEAYLDGRPVAAAAAMGAAGYGGGWGEDRPTQALRAQQGGPATSVMAPSDDGYGNGYDDRYDDRDSRRRKNNTSTVLLVVAGLLVLVGALFIGRALFGGDPPNSTSVPSLRGLEYEQAVGRLDSVGLVAEEGGVRPCEDVDEGLVCETDPAADTEVERGSVVTVYTAAGPEDVTIPNVVGERYEDAVATLREAGLDVERRNEVTDEAEEGTVLGQDPGADEEVEPGSTVTLTVATAPEDAEVPDVVGLSFEDAQRRLEQEGFTVARRDRESGDVAAGQVLAQDPTAGSRRAPGSQITVTVALEPQPTQVQVPNVVGQSFDEARAQLEGLGLRVERRGPGGGNSVVVGTDPGAGNAVEEGGTVQVFTQRGGGDNGGNGGDDGGDDGGGGDDGDDDGGGGNGGGGFIGGIGNG
ncbi:Stk1 family PASTA domain-containing Ser/Thr kinase [Streptomyces alkaliphilus]|uniref:non-specific serine/threonine protein kinase n=1 Tax=Streptomyces alkaliphilus TaxID=1472722 RepID=A0A7W3TBN8_9ACTN|nr:Stk1 family PASTA domain-containing Ser/Thr kinase [Streptomyces alkaliphilus]MBB0243906.1 Stk1 family PASTA domain-containing Ser/Thr kinase [Streptomyces alkaliphilus]